MTCDKSTMNWPAFSGMASINAGLGASLSLAERLSRRITSVPKGLLRSVGLYDRATSPINVARVRAPWENEALTVSTMEEFKPGSCISGCLIVVLTVLFRERPDLME